MVEMPVDDLKVMLEAGYLYLSMKRFKEAQDIFEGVSALAPKSEVPVVGLGNVFFVQHKFKEAIKTYEKALKIVPNSAFALSYLGESLIFEGESDRAREVLSEASQIDKEGKSGDFARALLDLMDKGFNPGQEEVTQ